jgi:hypothetical protein
MDELLEAYLGIYEANKAEVHLNMSDEDKQKRRNIRWADNAHGIDRDNTIMIRDNDTANLVNKMRVSRHKKNPSLDKEMTRGTVTNKYLHRQQDKKELQDKLKKSFSMSENIEYIIDMLVSEGYVNDYDSAACIIEAMSDEWIEDILTEAPFQIYGPDPHGPSDSEPRPIGKPYKNKRRAKNRADRMDQEIGGYRHSVRYVEDDK